ncbi:hypothetical protein ACEWPM_005925 [Roseovarius sp. S4756]|uniref:hypothetical protein n=1 Tax=Roseovarius maritimus TaxID=3342637 RepID=UPI0037275DCC
MTAAASGDVDLVDKVDLKTANLMTRKHGVTFHFYARFRAIAPRVIQLQRRAAPRRISGISTIAEVAPGCGRVWTIHCRAFANALRGSPCLQGSEPP